MQIVSYMFYFTKQSIRAAEMFEGTLYLHNKCRVYIGGTCTGLPLASSECFEMQRDTNEILQGNSNYPGVRSARYGGYARTRPVRLSIRGLPKPRTRH